MLSFDMIYHLIHLRSGVPTILANLTTVPAVFMALQIISRPEWFTVTAGVGTMVFLVVDSHMAIQVTGSPPFCSTSIIRARDTSLGGWVSFFGGCLIFSHSGRVPVGPVPRLASRFSEKS